MKNFKVSIKLVILSLFCFLSSNLLSNNVYINYYAKSLLPYSILNFNIYSDEYNKIKGFYLTIPKNSVELDIIILAKNATVKLYKAYTDNNNDLHKSELIAETKSVPADWTRLKFNKLNEDTNVFLSIDFSNSQYYKPDVLITYPIYTNNNIKVVYNYTGNNYNETYVDDTSLVDPNIKYYTLDNLNNLNFKPYIRIIKEGNYKLKSVVSQPGISWTNTKVRLKIECFNKCPELTIDYNNDNIIDDYVSDNSNNDLNKNDNIIYYEYSYNGKGIYHPKVCIKDSNECLSSDIIIGKSNIEINSIFKDNLVMQWPKNEDYANIYAYNMADKYEQMLQSNAFKYYQIERDFLPNFYTIQLNINYEFTKENCLLLSPYQLYSDAGIFNCSTLTGINHRYIIGSNDISSGISSAILSTSFQLVQDWVISLTPYANTHALSNDTYPFYTEKGIALLASNSPFYMASLDNNHDTFELLYNKYSQYLIKDILKYNTMNVTDYLGDPNTMNFSLYSTSVNGIFPNLVLSSIYKDNNTLNTYINYYNDISYLTHKDSLYKNFHLTDDDVWNQFIDWINNKLPEFHMPKLEVIDKNNLKFKFISDSSDLYLVKIYVNGSLIENNIRYIKANEEFSLNDYKIYNLKNIRLFVRSVKLTQYDWPLQSRIGHNYILLFKENSTINSTVNFLNGTTHIKFINYKNNINRSDNTFLYFWIAEQTKNNPNIYVYKNKICYDYNNYNVKVSLYKDNILNYTDLFNYTTRNLIVDNNNAITENSLRYCYLINNDNNIKYAVFNVYPNYLNDFLNIHSDIKNYLKLDNNNIDDNSYYIPEFQIIYQLPSIINLTTAENSFNYTNIDDLNSNNINKLYEYNTNNIIYANNNIYKYNILNTNFNFNLKSYINNEDLNKDAKLLIYIIFDKNDKNKNLFLEKNIKLTNNIINYNILNENNQIHDYFYKLKNLLLNKHIDIYYGYEINNKLYYNSYRIIFN